jgi:hypothetical protein
MGLILRTTTATNAGNALTIKGSALTYPEGDNNFMYLLTNMSGSAITIIGNTTISGSLTVNSGIAGTLYGTSSYALTASYQISSSYSSTSTSASYASGSTTASYALTASYVPTSSYALTASYALNAPSVSGYLTTASFNSATGSFITTGSAAASQKITGSLTISSSNNPTLSVFGPTKITHPLSTTPTLNLLSDSSGFGFILFENPNTGNQAGTAIRFLGDSGGTDYSGQFYSTNNNHLLGKNRVGFEAIATSAVLELSSRQSNVDINTVGPGTSYTKLRIFNNGNVAVGTDPSDSGYKFKVVGDGSFSSNLTVTGSLTSTSTVNLTGIGSSNQSSLVGYNASTGQLTSMLTSSIVGTVTSGNYVPVVSTSGNVAIINMSTLNYYRSNDMVTVFGVIQLMAVSAGVCSANFNLPIASALYNSYDGRIAGIANTATANGIIIGIGNEAQLQMNNVAASGLSYAVLYFSYKVV